VTGHDGMRRLQEDMQQARAAGNMSEHDAHIGLRIARALTGGDVESGAFVAEDTLLDLERQGFVELIQHPLTRARIDHMLKTGKALHN
jgi:3-hydroxyacyl-CoA dehydrogenase